MISSRLEQWRYIPCFGANSLSTVYKMGPTLLAIILGCIAAISWGIGNVSRSTAVRKAKGSLFTAAFVICAEAIVYFLFFIMNQLIFGPYDLTSNFILPNSKEVPWIITSAVLSVIGMTATFMALRHGKIAIMVPITSASGFIAALCGVLMGAHLSVVLIFAALMLFLGMYLVTTRGEVHHGDESSIVNPHERHIIVGFALSACITLGISNYCIAHLGNIASPIQALIWTRTMTCILLVPTLVTMGQKVHEKFQYNKSVGVSIMLAAIFGAGGLGMYVVAGGYNIVLASLVATQFGTIAALIGIYRFKEHLTRGQIMGISIIALGLVMVVLGR